MNKQKTASILNALVIWAVLNGWIVFGGFSQLPVIELAMGYAGTGAVIAVGVLLSKFNFGNFVAYCGQNSILIFLSYFIFMAGTRIVLLKSDLVSDPGIIALIVTFSGVAGPLVFFQIIRKTPLVFLYQRHPVAHIISAKPAGKIQLSQQS